MSKQFHSMGGDNRMTNAPAIGSTAYWAMRRESQRRFGVTSTSNAMADFVRTRHIDDGSMHILQHRQDRVPVPHPDVIEPNVEAVDDETAKRLLAGYSSVVVDRGLDKLLVDIDLVDTTDGHVPPADWRINKLLNDAADRHISGTRADDGNGFDFIDHTPRA